MGTQWFVESRSIEEFGELEAGFSINGDASLEATQIDMSLNRPFWQGVSGKLKEILKCKH